MGILNEITTRKRFVKEFQGKKTTLADVVYGGFQITGDDDELENRGPNNILKSNRVKFSIGNNKHINIEFDVVDEDKDVMDSIINVVKVELL